MNFTILSSFPSIPFTYFLLQVSRMGEAVHSVLAPGHFLFTSESVGEGHPGMLNASRCCVQN